MSNVIVRRKPIPPVTISGEWALSSELSLEAKGLYLYILAMADPTYLTVKAISVGLKEDEKKISRAAKELTAYGWIEGLE